MNTEQTQPEQSYSWRKKPVTINAVRNDGEWKPIFAFLEYLMGTDPVIPFGSRPPITRNPDGSLNVETLEGTMLANVGDWLICGVRAEFYPCKPDIFEATYERGSSS